MRKFFCSFFLAFFVFCPIYLCGFVFIDQNNDFQFWNIVTFQGEISKKWGYELASENRWGFDLKHHFYVEPSIDFVYKLCKWIQILPGYHQIWVADFLKGGKYIRQYKPLVAITLHLDRHKWKIIDRNRFELIMFDRGKPIYVYRNRVSLLPPFKIGHVKPYLQDEFFWTEGFGINQNRLYLGGQMKINKHYKMQFYYLLRNIKPTPDSWRKVNVMGISMVCKF